MTKLVAPKRPIKPREPIKPVEPKEFVESSGSSNIYDGITLKEIMDILPEGIDLSRASISFSIDYDECYYDCSPSIIAELTYDSGLVRNPRYNRELAAYKKKMEIYEIKMTEYKEAMDEYKIQMNKYKADKEKYKIDKEKCEKENEVLTLQHYKIFYDKKIKLIEKQLDALKGKC